MPLAAMGGARKRSWGSPGAPVTPGVGLWAMTPLLLPRRRRKRTPDAPPGLRVRRLEEQDLHYAGAISAAAFGIDVGTSEKHARWLDRVEHAMRTDPEGCFVAEDGGSVVGVAQAILREGLWVLSLLTVDPLRQDAGAGRALVRRTLDYGPPDAPGLIISSNDPRALRLYGRAGFSLQPAFQAEGTIDRRALPAVGRQVVEDDVGDLEALAPVSRLVRGAAHTPSSSSSCAGADSFFGPATGASPSTSRGMAHGCSSPATRRRPAPCYGAPSRSCPTASGVLCAGSTAARTGPWTPPCGPVCVCWPTARCARVAWWGRCGPLSPARRLASAGGPSPGVPRRPSQTSLPPRRWCRAPRPGAGRARARAASDGRCG